MAGIGLYGVFYAKATVEGGVVTGYTGGVQTMGKAISASFEPNESADNPLYANNAIAETDASGSSGGTLTLTLDKLTLAAAADLYGLTVTDATATVDGESVTGQGFDYTGNEESAPVGVAFIRWNQEEGSRAVHEAVIYRRVTFSMPGEDAETLGESVEWQTPEIEGTVMGKEGDGTNAWRKKYVFPTHDAAMAFITEYFAAV